MDNLAHEMDGEAYTQEDLDEIDRLIAENDGVVADVDTDDEVVAENAAEQEAAQVEDEELDIDVQAIYDAQEGEVYDTAPEATEEEMTVKPTKRRGSASQKNIIDLEVALGGGASGSACAEALKAQVAAIGPKKVASKADNIIAVLTGRRKSLSCYTLAALRHVSSVSNATAVSVREIEGAIALETGCALTTARVQAQQMMVLFPAIGLADRHGPELTARSSTPLHEALSAVLSQSEGARDEHTPEDTDSVKEAA